MSRRLGRALIAAAVVVGVAACGSVATTSRARPSPDGTTTAPAVGAHAVVSPGRRLDPAVPVMAAAFREAFAGPRGAGLVARVEVEVADPAMAAVVPADLVAMVRFVHEHADDLVGAFIGSTADPDLATSLRQQTWYQRLSTTGRAAKQDPAAVVERYRRSAVVAAWSPKARLGPDAVAADLQTTMDEARSDASVVRLGSDLDGGVRLSFDDASVAALDDVGVGLLVERIGPAVSTTPLDRVGSASTASAGQDAVVAVGDAVTGPGSVVPCPPPESDFVRGVVALAVAGIELFDLVATGPGGSQGDAVRQLFLTSFSGPVGSAWAGSGSSPPDGSCRSERRPSAVRQPGRG